MRPYGGNTGSVPGHPGGILQILKSLHWESAEDEEHADQAPRGGQRWPKVVKDCKGGQALRVGIFGARLARFESAATGVLQTSSLA